MGPLDLLQRLSHGENSSTLGLGRLPGGFIDLRKLHLPRPRQVAKIPIDRGMSYVVDKPTFEGCRLEQVDISESDLAESVWRDFALKNVRFDEIRGRHVKFGSGTMEGVSFREADLRLSHWGTSGTPGPTVASSDFTRADLRGSTYARPLFKNCTFADSDLRGVMFVGARFEDCVFRGLVEKVTFFGWYPPDEPQDPNLRNTMTNVDFSSADLRFVEFLTGLDVSSCRFPDKGLLSIRRPKETFQRVAEEVHRTWEGKSREVALRYLEKMIKVHFTAAQDLWVVRPADLVKSGLGKEVGEGLLKEIEMHT